MAPTIGMQSYIRFLKEATEGTVDDSATKKLELFSDSTVKAQIALRRNRKARYDIGSRVAKGIIEGTEEYDVIVTHRWQDLAVMYSGTTTGFIPDALVALSTNRLNTFSLEYCMAEDAAVRSFYTFKGAKVSKCVARVNRDDEWELEWTFWPLTCTTSATLPVYTNITRPAAVAGAYFSFTGATIESPVGTALAFAVENANFEVDNSLVRRPGVGSVTHKTTMEGRQVVKYSGDVTVDDGGKALWDAVAVAGGTGNDIVIKLSTTSGKPKITLKKIVIDELQYESDDESAEVMTGPERLATEGLTLGVV